MGLTRAGPQGGAAGTRAPSSGSDLRAEILSQREAIEAPCRESSYSKFVRMAKNPENHFVVSFGGGSLHGLSGNCALAVLLEELGLRPYVKQVWGTSAGSIVGGSWASGTPADQMIGIVESLKDKRALDIAIWHILRRTASFLASLGLSRLLARRLPDGLVHGRVFRGAIREAMAVERIEQCDIPFRAITCTDDGHARKVVLTEGSLEEAAFASMHIPGVFLPLEKWSEQETGYFDGGVVEKTPLPSIIEEHVRSGPATKLFIVCTHFDSEARVEKPLGFLSRFVSILNHLEGVAWQHQLQSATLAPNCTTSVLNPRMQMGGIFDFGYVRANYLWARKSFKKKLSNASFPLTLH